jgi:hypothetical protein
LVTHAAGAPLRATAVIQRSRSAEIRVRIDVPFVIRIPSSRWVFHRSNDELYNFKYA